MENERVERELETVGPDHYSGGMFCVAATMRRMHRAARRTLLCQAFMLRCWAQTIRGNEDRAIRGCKVAIGATVRTLVASTRVASTQMASTRVATKDLSRDDAAFKNRVLIRTDAMDYIEPQRFLEDTGSVVLERVRDAVERHGSVK